MKKKMLLASLLLAAIAPAAPCWAAEAPVLLAAYEAGTQELLDAAKKNLAAGQFEEAIGNLSEADAQCPDDEGIAELMKEAKQQACLKYVHDGDKLLSEKNYADALNAFESALELNAKDASALKGKEHASNWPQAEQLITTAKAMLANGQVDDAIRCYQRAFDLVEDPDVAKRLAEIKAKRGKK